MCALVRPCAMVSCSEKVHIQLTTRFGLSVLNCSIYLKLKWPNMIQDGAWWYQLMNFQNAECPKWWISKMLNVQMMNVFEPFWNCTIPKTKIIKNTLKSFHWHHLVLCTWHQLVPPGTILYHIGPFELQIYRTQTNRTIRKPLIPMVALNHSIQWWL